MSNIYLFLIIFLTYILWPPKDPALSKTGPQTQNTPMDPSTPTCPLSEKDSKQIHTPPLHLKRMSEDLEIDKKHDRECAPGHPEVPSVKAHGRESLTRDTVGSNGEPKSSSELQHAAGDALENIGPVEEPLPGNCRRTQFKVIPCNLTKTLPDARWRCVWFACLRWRGHFSNLKKENVFLLLPALGLSMSLAALLVCIAT